MCSKKLIIFRMPHSGAIIQGSTLKKTGEVLKIPSKSIIISEIKGDVRSEQDS